MSRQARFEVVRTDAGWHARFTSTQIIAWTETYARKVGAQRAVRSIVRGVLSVAADWLDEYAQVNLWGSPAQTPQQRAGLRMAADLLRQASTANEVAASLTDSERGAK